MSEQESVIQRAIRHLEQEGWGDEAEAVATLTAENAALALENRRLDKAMREAYARLHKAIVMPAIDGLALDATKGQEGRPQEEESTTKEIR